ncbi:hypothetical protein M1E25_01895 [Streptomyces sp. MTZ3.1]|uniref:DUF5134 domain-containing protein n=1 Tax=Streptomyces meridianus TaxID=2938945 RepID=A0ABT0X0M6_9ACTN|nr:hypothetical protein [Streptomyces meridianus]MCM2576115.1 hypothetical protein [Streptomyces meridianus]
MRPVERACYATGLALMVSGIFHLGVFAVDGGPWDGPVSWRKPTTFGVSFGLTLITVTWVASYLALRPRLRTVLLTALAVDSVLEVTGVTLQAWRGVPSHINRETPFDSTVSTLLAAGGGVLVLVLTTLAVQAFGRGSAQQRPSMRLALRAGFAAMLVALASGAAMIARGVATEKAGDRQLAYHVVGFLKPLHGVCLHGVLVLPALAWLLSRTDWPECRRTRAVTAGICCYALAVLGAGALSLAG